MPCGNTEWPKQDPTTVGGAACHKHRSRSAPANLCIILYEEGTQYRQESLYLSLVGVLVAGGAAGRVTRTAAPVSAALMLFSSGYLPPPQVSLKSSRSSAQTMTPPKPRSMIHFTCRVRNDQFDDGIKVAHNNNYCAAIQIYFCVKIAQM